MSDFASLVVVFFAAINPAAVALAAETLGLRARPDRLQVLGLAAAVAGALLLLAAATAGMLLDALDIAPETFRIAAGIVMVSAAAHAVFRARAAGIGGEGSWRDGIAPLGLPMLAGPAAMAAAISYGADDGAGRTFGAAVVIGAIALALVALGTRGWAPLADGIARLTGALLVAVSVGLIVDGVRDI